MLNARNILIYLSLIHDGDWKKIYYSISQREKLTASDDEINKAVSSVKSKAVTLLDDDYPEYLKGISHPPFVLFYYGDLSLIKDYKKNLGVVGSRECSPYGDRVTQLFVSKICKKKCIVSGLARGIDSIAHKTAIENKGKTVAVLGSGIDNCYPYENKELYEEIKKNHLVISEYPGNSQPDMSHFPLRNRFIAAFSKGILVTEAKLKSGTMITANFAIEFGREVMCVPTNIGVESGCNALIKEGACLVEKYEDVIEILRDDWEEKNPKIS